jgi:uncharacterized protein (TIGR00255 family)
MIYSMTGFAVAAAEVPHGTLNLELRSVNHRYLEVQFRLPDELRALETAMRELIAARLSRGKVDCRLSFAPLAAGTGELQLNTDLLQQQSPDSQSLRVGEVLRWPGMLGPESVPLEGLKEPALELCRNALDELSSTRGREGEKLKAMLLQRIVHMRHLAAGVAPRLPKLLAAYQEKLAGRLREALGTSDDERVRQELALFAQKIDVDEELSRLQAHLSEVERILDTGGAAGKRLDFLMQELNREANTLGSKSVAAEVSQVSMELKVLIEQMREQIQNIE